MTVSAEVSHDSTSIFTTAGVGVRWPVTVDKWLPGSARCASIIGRVSRLHDHFCRCFRCSVLSHVVVLALDETLVGIHHCRYG